MTDEKILEIFRKNLNHFVSGEEISEALGISRQALWKHIEKLRLEGYTITASPHLGYRLEGIPDKLYAHEIAWNLNTKVIGKRIISYNLTDSTNDLAYKLGESKEKEGTVIFAERQSKGKGRLERRWLSPEGGIYFSVILRPDITPSESSKVTIMAAVAVNKAIKNETGVISQIKWPNDILVKGQKVSGILTEMKGELDKVSFIVLGIGINVNTDISKLPPHSTSLKKEAGQEALSRINLARTILKELDTYYEKIKKGEFEIIREEWKKMSYMIGKRVKISYHNRDIEGYALDMDSDGALLIRKDHGFIERILSGDVILVR